MKKVIGVSLSLVLLFLSACSEPSLNSARKAAEKYIKYLNPSAEEWIVGSNSENNAVIVKLYYKEYKLNLNKVSQDDLDWWASFIEKVKTASDSTKSTMDDTGYIADCFFYIFDASVQTENLLVTKNGEVLVDYLEGVVDNTMTLDKFNSIRIGMTYRQVVKIIGADGQLGSVVDIGPPEYKTELYHWYAANGIGNATITFQNGKVISMAQAGL